METIAKGDADFAIIQHYATYEAVADCLFEFAQPTQVSRIHCGRCLDLNAGDGTRHLLDDNISNNLRCLAVAVIRFSARATSAPRAAFFQVGPRCHERVVPPRVTSISLSLPRCIGFGSACAHCRHQQSATKSAGKPDAVTCTLLLQEMARCC